jgi:hypothetical protein
MCFFKSRPLTPSGEDLLSDHDRVTVRVPLKNRLNRRSVVRFRQFRERHVDWMKGGDFGDESNHVQAIR